MFTHLNFFRRHNPFSRTPRRWAIFALLSVLIAAAAPAAAETKGAEGIAAVDEPHSLEADQGQRFEMLEPNYFITGFNRAGAGTGKGFWQTSGDSCSG